MLTQPKQLPHTVLAELQACKSKLQTVYHRSLLLEAENIRLKNELARLQQPKHSQ